MGKRRERRDRKPALDLSNPELRELLRSRCELTQYRCLHHGILTTWCRDRETEQASLLHGCDCRDPAAMKIRLENSPAIWETFTP